MSKHLARISWQRQTPGFSLPDYNRDHEWEFPGGVSLEASAAVAYHGHEARVDPEQALVAAVSSCHMLTFLAICARKGLVIDRYVDSAVGYLEKNQASRLAVTHIELSPEIEFAENAPSEAELKELHEKAHQQCFIANSVRTKISLLRHS